MSEFKKELRYYVVKVSDAQQFSDEAKHALENVLYASQIVRKLRDAPQIDCVVVESDWPEYEIVWGMIQARVEGRPNQITTLQSELAAARQEIARAREELIPAWAQNYYHEWISSKMELPGIMDRHAYKDAAKLRAESRYAREIAHAHKGEEG